MKCHTRSQPGPALADGLVISVSTVGTYDVAAKVPSYHQCNHSILDAINQQPTDRKGFGSCMQVIPRSAHGRMTCLLGKGILLFASPIVRSAPHGSPCTGKDGSEFSCCNSACIRSGTSHAQCFALQSSEGGWPGGHNASPPRKCSIAAPPATIFLRISSSVCNRHCSHRQR